MDRQSEQLRIGIIGAGGVATKHALAYSRNRYCAIVAVSDIDMKKGQALAAEYASDYYEDYRDLIRSAGVDAISVCVPHDLHREVGVAGARAGVHLLMEKPLTTSLRDADELLTECASAGVRLMLGFVHRFREEQLTAKQLVEAGSIGQPMHVLDKICTRGGSHPPAWVWQRNMAGGGVLMYGGIHSIDRLRWLTGHEIREVYASKLRYSNMGDVEDGISAVLTFDNGSVGCLFENSPSYGNPGGWLTEIYGTEGAIRVKNGEWLEVTAGQTQERRTFQPIDHFQREIDEFVAAIREHREPWISGEDGRRALAVALAIYQSSDSGQPVSVL